VSTLSALNGGTTHTITPPTVRQITGTNANYEQMRMYPQTREYGGYPLYGSDIFSDYNATLNYFSARVWLYYDSTNNRTTGAVIPESDGGPPYIGGRSGHYSAGSTSSGWGLPAGFSLDSALDLVFTCTSDAQQFDQPYVDWYTRQQTWVCKSRNARLAL
jgi:hypothetical protein